jgi:peptidoglycan/xylan/chitin deacetylase (PgdA/CDA1 family)
MLSRCYTHSNISASNLAFAELMKIKNKSILKLIFRLVNNNLQGLAPSKREFESIKIAPYYGNAHAAVSISADFELNWAWRNLNPEERDLRGNRERQNFGYVLDLLNDYSVPVTWATVGHLFLDTCNKNARGIAHEEMPRPNNPLRCTGDWYSQDPVTDYLEDPLWYAPDLIEQILESPVPHELGTHSFSHISFSPELSDSELVVREIDACLGVMKRFGVQPKSLVFPFNEMGYSYLRELSSANIIAVRHRDSKIRLSYPERTEHGVYKIYESMNLRRPSYYDYLDKAKIFIRQAIKNNAAYHLWFHPSDPKDIFENEFRKIVEFIAVERDRGNIWVATMGELAAYCEARETLNIGIEKRDSEIELKLDSRNFDKCKYGNPKLTLLMPTLQAPRSVTLLYKGHRDEGPCETLLFKHKGAQLVLNIPIAADSVRVTF